MNNISRRKLITTGLAATASVAGLAAAARLAGRYGLIPPDHGGIYGPGETLTYAVQRLMTSHSLAREFPRSMISKTPFANPTAPPSEVFKRHQAADFSDWRLAVDGMVATPASLSLSDIRSLPVHNQITEVACEEGLVLYCRVDRDASGECAQRRWAFAASAVYRVLLNRTRLVGKHRHGRRPASSDFSHFGNE